MKNFIGSPLLLAAMAIFLCIIVAGYFFLMIGGYPKGLVSETALFCGVPIIVCSLFGYISYKEAKKQKKI
ncbi:hypothetical protein ACN6MY_11115 [Peribacillus sp. B-H-3]|uniref:hypothetical protein n=1 Tax=Peribacillus sp. B-H-3 TaxID=3400420 RepID=UPI003B02C235